ncbi:UTP--glucose-1-phosphate uridylyltransferase [Candidatus Gracilibacteria bacterium]|nr:MAG: UTP--glucose-1-phosphate uridylyltransferase [Candidatus Gracilibacteria bacterium]PIE85324.1 MAG: UTP--glucose-1-phosphate uridylyltransferase [Candidatus Gracilibacteria bacterium]
MKNDNDFLPIKKCIIPAAGYGTRFLPATKALPKEMFPIIDKPVMQLLVEEAIGAGCTDIIIVTGRSKRAIEDHFDSNLELENRLDKDGKFDYLKVVKNLNKMANIVYVRQPYPKGDGDAILRAKNLIGEEPFLVLFGDDLVEGEKSAALQLVETFQRKNSPVIATVKVSDDEVSSYGIIEHESIQESPQNFVVSKFLEKPKKKDTSSRLGVIGKYVLTPNIFNYLEKATSSSGDGEIRLADAFELMRREKDIYGVDIKGTRYDTGSKIGFLKATVSYALKRKDLKDEFKKFLKGLDLK